jgi:uncharacterized membrane protein
MSAKASSLARPDNDQQRTYTVNSSGSTLMALAVAALLTQSAGCASAARADDGEQVVKCKGVNECKGKGACGGTNKDGSLHGCTGQNDCKGQGWIEVPSKECASRGGSVVE